MKIAGTGFSGFLGSHIARRLAAEGAELTALVRPGGRLAVLREAAPRAAVVEGDLTDPEALGRLVAGQEAVVHAAYLTPGAKLDQHFREDPIAYRQKFLADNLLTTTELLSRAARAGVQHFLYISTHNLYGRMPHEGLLTEETAPRPNNAYAAVKLSSEAFCLAMAGAFPRGVTIFRPPAIYGINPNFARSRFRPLAEAALKGEVVQAGGGTNMVAAVDIAAAVWLALNKHEEAQGVINLTDLYFDQADAAELIREIIGPEVKIEVGKRRGPPATPTPSARARALGVPFGGRAGLKRYLEQLVAKLRGQ